MKTYSITLPLALLFGAHALRTEVEPLSTEFKSQTIDQLITVMNEDYVDTAVAKKVEADLRARQSKGEFDGIDKGADFARMITEDMNALCKDAHLRMRFSKDPLPVRANRSEPSKEEVAQYERMMHLMNGGINSAERLVGNVGYIDTTGFMAREFAEKPIDAAMAFVENTDALIIDMRFNGGGHPDTVRYLCSYFFDPKPVLLNTIYMRGQKKPEEFWTLSKLPSKRYLNKEVYVLTGKRTASGAEEFTYNLKNLHRSMTIGESTWGGANPGGTVRLNDHFAVFVPHGKAINPYTKTNWEGTGVEPDIKVEAKDALKTALTLAIKRLRDKATTDDDKERLANALKAAEAGQTK